MRRKELNPFRRLPRKIDATISEVALSIGLPRNTFLAIQTGHRKPPSWIWERIALAFGILPPLEGSENNRFRNIFGEILPDTFSTWWRETALPFLSEKMSKRQEAIPSWQDNEAALLKALLLAAKKQSRLPLAANVIRRSLLDAAKTLGLEDQWEHEARAAGAKSIHYVLAPVDFGEGPIPSVSITSRPFSLSASPVPIVAAVDDEDLSTSNTKRKKP